jgi:hypothetical protein
VALTGSDLRDEYKCVLPSRRHPLHLDERGRFSLEITLRPPKVDLNQPVFVRFAITDAQGPPEFVESEAKWYDLDLFTLQDLGSMLTAANQIRGSFTEVIKTDFIDIYQDVFPLRIDHRLVMNVYGHEFALWWRRWRGRSGAERVERELLVFGWSFWLGEAPTEMFRSERCSFTEADFCCAGYMLVDPEECVAFGKELANTVAQVNAKLWEEANQGDFWDDYDAD